MSDSEDPEVDDKRFKFVIVGDGAAGKTSIITRYVQEQFGRQYDQTIGLDFYQKRVVFSDDKSAILSISDIGGQTLGGKMLDKYIYGASAVLFVYDITNSESFSNIDDWLTTVQETIDKPAHFALVGNKGDLEHIRTVTKSQHEEFASERGMSSHFVSAKTGSSIDLCFKKIVADIMKIKLSRTDLDTSNVIIKADIHAVPQSSRTQLPSKRKKTKSLICSIQ